MTSDANKGITGIEYNYINQPTKITVGGANSGTIDYVYAADGTKLRKTTSTGLEVDYSGGYVYNNGVLQFFPHPEGYVSVENGNYEYVYNYLDHLGNVRLSYTEDPSNPGQPTIIEENNYYPMGMKHKGYNEVVSPLGNPIAKKWKFQGVEFEEALDIDLYEMEFRNYDPAIGRFISVDPLADQRNWLTPYNFVQNNPISRVDPLGLLDTYGVNDDGNVVWLDDKTYHDDNGNEVDRLYAIDDKNNIVDSESKQEYATATVDSSTEKSFLFDLASDNVGSDFGVTSNLDDALDVFKFSSDNSKVEFGVQGFQLDNGDYSYVVGTSRSDNYALNAYNLGLSGGYTVDNIQFDLHSHTRTAGASGYTTGKPTGDRKRQFGHYNQNGGKLSLHYYIYHTPTNGLYRYGPRDGDQFIGTINESSDFVKKADN